MTALHSTHEHATLELRGITKRFGALTANDHIDLEVRAGEIHCLLGENGAGKSTLMNVLYGLYQADEGEILLDVVQQRFAGPGDAMHAGIGMVHQHFMLIPVFTVAENVLLGHEKALGGLAGAKQKVREISQRFGFHVDPDAKIEDLPVGVQHPGAEVLADLAPRGKAGHDDLPGDVVGVDGLGAPFGEHRRHRALARGDASREPDEQHPVAPSSRSR